MKKKFSSKAIRQMEANANRGTWYNLVKLEEIPAFSQWLHTKEWQAQSPDAGEAMRAYKNGWTITVGYNGHRTACRRLVMALWLTYECLENKE